MKNIKALGAAGLVLLMVTAAPVWAAGDDGGSRATASASKVSKQLKSLKKRIAALESKPDAVGGAPSGVPSGPAGGALTGTYPDPGLAANSVDTAQVTANAIGSNEVEDGSLNGLDVGRAAGTVFGFDPPSLAGGACLELTVNLGIAPVNVQDDAFAVTVGQGWNSVLTVTPETSPTVGRLMVNVCNQLGTPVDQDPVQLNWVALDV